LSLLQLRFSIATSPKTLVASQRQGEKKSCIGQSNFDCHWSKTLIIMQQSKNQKKMNGQVNRISVTIQMNKTFDCHWSKTLVAMQQLNK
jgi:hypothetical protein